MERTDMNWLIQSTNKLCYHTNLAELLNPILNEVQDFTWFISDLEFSSDKALPINMNDDFFILSSQEFKNILSSKTQIVWGVISGFSKGTPITFNRNSLPYAEGNELIWENGNLQMNNAEIEIIAFDSTFTIIKFNSENLSEKFKKYFVEAMALDKN